MKHIVMFSGGAGSYAAAKRVVAEVGAASTLLVFADTKMEDEDLYRFLRETSEHLGAELVTLTEGRTPWEVFFDVRFLGNTRIDPCSRVLKRELIRSWLEENYPDPSEVVMHLGIDWTEEHRYLKAIPHHAPYTVRAPMCEEPLIEKDQMVADLAADGIEPPRLYALGFPHNNCGGFCIKAGQAHFKLLLDTMPERYAYHEQQEQDFRTHVGKDVAVLRDRRGGTTKPLTLRTFRERLEADTTDLDSTEWGGCGCFSPEE